MFVHRLLHVLLNYSYIAILYSICRCTVQNVCPKKKMRDREEGGRERKKDSLHCQSDQMGLKEKQGATESIGSCRNWWVLSGRLFSSVPLLLRSTSLCILTWSIIIGWKKKARFTSVGWNLVCVFVLIWLPEDQLWTVVRLISTACAGVQTRGEKEKKLIKKSSQRTEKTGQRTRCWYMQTQWHRFGKG